MRAMADSPACARQWSWAMKGAVQTGNLGSLMRATWAAIALLVMAALLSPSAHAARAAGDDAAPAKHGTAGLTRADGYVPFWFDPKGRVLMEVPVFNEDVLYYVSAAT